MIKTAFSTFIKLPLIALFLVLSFPSFSFAQAEQSKSDLSTFDLVLKVNNLNSFKGKLYAQLVSEQGDVLENIVQPIHSEEIQSYTFNNLPEGVYAIRVFHDRNDNGKLDTNLLGIPKERFGFSNNVMGKFGPPELEAQLFRHSERGELIITLIGR